MFFVEVAMSLEFGNELVGRFQSGDVFAGKESRQSILPGLVVAFDFAFGLRSWGIAEGDTVKAQCIGQLGGTGMGEEQGMVIDIDLQWQAVGDKGGGQQIQVSQEVF